MTPNNWYVIDRSGAVCEIIADDATKAATVASDWDGHYPHGAPHVAIGASTAREALSKYHERIHTSAETLDDTSLCWKVSVPLSALTKLTTQRDTLITRLNEAFARTAKLEDEVAELQTRLNNVTLLQHNAEHRVARLQARCADARSFIDERLWPEAYARVDAAARGDV